MAEKRELIIVLPTMDYLRTFLMCGVMIALAILAYFLLNFIFSHPYKAEAPAMDELEIWIDKLVNYECPNCPYGFRKLDTNGYYSYGCLQFQKPTFTAGVSRYFKGLANSEDVDKLIHDCNFQKQLAYAMFSTDKNAYLHWKTSVITRGLGLPPR